MRNRCCCNCRHNIRIGKETYIDNYCEIHNRRIGYYECLEGWCRRWAKENNKKYREEQFVCAGIDLSKGDDYTVLVKGKIQ